MTVRLYHNPRCSKSRQSLKLIEDTGIKIEVVEYLKHPPSVDELAKISQLLGLSAREFMRKNEPEYKELQLDNKKLSEKELLRVMHEHPKLIERPILVTTNAARIGRPPESVLEII